MSDVDREGESDDEYPGQRFAALALVDEIRSLEEIPVRRDLTLAVAALFRCAHLLEAMAERPKEDPLVPMGLRDIIETSINGLVCAAAPDHIERFVQSDLTSRLRLAERVDAPQHLIDEVRSRYAIVENSPQAMPFTQRVDELARARPDLFDQLGEVNRIKAMYINLSNFFMHGGVGVLDYYLSADPSAGPEIVPTPTFWMGTNECLAFGCRFTRALLAAVRPTVASP